MPRFVEDDELTGPTRAIAAFAANMTPAGVPDTVLDRSARHVLDTVGLMLSGSTSDGSRLTQEFHAERGGTPEATVLGVGTRANLLQAAYANGESAHAMDYDDTQLAAAPDRAYGLLMHPSSPVLGAVLPVAEWLGSSGEDALVAFAIGVEVSCVIAEAISPTHYGNGLHCTGTIGGFGAAVAAGRLLGLDVDQMAVALGVVGSMSAGLRQNFGTMTKPLHAGRAAENGVLAALRVAKGHSATDDILEAPRGFFRAYGGGDLDQIEGALGAPWTILDPGISIKPYPSGSLTHPAVGATIALVNESDVRADQIDHIRVGVNSYTALTLLHATPIDELQAKFSMQYGVAIAALDRAAGLEQFTTERVVRADAQAMLRRVKVEVDERAEAAGFDQMYSVVTIHLVDGSTVERQASFAKGSPADPMTDAELLAKFEECVGLVDPAADAAATAAELLAIRTVGDVRSLRALQIRSAATT
jgi:2-methylcitrate dehydratase PrpD